MQRMGLRAIYQKPRTTVPGEPSERFPTLVDFQLLTAPDQVWATDITYIPLRKGFLYLVAIVDLFSRHVLAWRLSNSLDTEFCLEALEMALASGRRPQIFHSDQGCHSHPQPSFNDSRLRRYRSAGQEESAVLTTSWWRGYGAPSSMRKCICVPTVMAGRRRSAWPDSCGGTAM
jgi:transposase InsO family protein